MDTTSILLSSAFVLASTPVAWAGVRLYRLYGGLRLVTCPETVEAALVKLHAGRTIASRLAGGNDLCLRSCSRWPEKKACDQACLAQIGHHQVGALSSLPRGDGRRAPLAWPSARPPLNVQN